MEHHNTEHAASSSGQSTSPPSRLTRRSTYDTPDRSLSGDENQRSGKRKSMQRTSSYKRSGEADEDDDEEENDAEQEEEDVRSQLSGEFTLKDRQDVSLLSMIR